MAEAGPALGGWWVPLHHPAPSTVAECTRLRESGDWTGACRAAGVSPRVDLAAVAAEHGATAARRVRDDLAQFAPDLLRCHLGDGLRLRRGWPGAVLTDLAKTSAESAYGPVRLPDGPVLALVPPETDQAVDNRARLVVLAPDQVTPIWTAVPVWCWRADAHAARRYAYRVGHPQAARDTTALRNGVMTRHQLHPLTFASLYPGEVRTPPAPGREFPAVRVRCATVWHEVQVVGGTLVAREHTGQEIQRELALGALGGPVAGCAAALRTWRTGWGRLPKRLRWQREFFFRCAREGRGDVVLAMLDAGFDPAVVDGGGATLLHLLSGLDHGRLLPRLLAAGLPVDGRDKLGETPLHHAWQAGADDVIAALLAAGADAGLADRHGRLPV
ncbi:ankyrin repeat domain-containing protein [Catellatospora sichuanensis]|uniref:ankyrin repeat domain-containing protein n=1 Tax=Catellatospora sichuanensis TaxID=1969805 RepID=UPI0011840285|nr:ankyrin repeat domain-containing protein [Catellatospora sichuanensis]